MLNRNELLQAILDAIPLTNYSALAAPTVNDDVNAGYGVGSEWYYAGGGAGLKLFNCVDSTAGAAVWLAVG